MKGEEIVIIIDDWFTNNRNQERKYLSVVQLRIMHNKMLVLSEYLQH